MRASRACRERAARTSIVASARARVAQASATLKEAQGNLARLEEVARLSGGKVPSQAELDTGTRSDDFLVRWQVEDGRGGSTDASAIVDVPGKVRPCIAQNIIVVAIVVDVASSHSHAVLPGVDAAFVGDVGEAAAAVVGVDAAAGRTSPRMALMSVDFPAPFGPTMAMSTPAGTTTSTSQSTGCSR